MTALQLDQPYDSLVDQLLLVLRWQETTAKVPEEDKRRFAGTDSGPS